MSTRSLTTAHTVYIVDDEAVLRDALSWLMRSRRLMPETYASADEFWAALQSGRIPLDQPSVLLLDMRMPGMNGMALFERLVANGHLAVLPVIFLTGHAEVASAVQAVKRGAFDFVEKPFSDNALADRVILALEASRAGLAQAQAQAGVQARLDELTERERDVMVHIIEGWPNKQIADALEISVRTVEVHRARVFDKMQVKSAVELSNLLRSTEGRAP